MNGLLMAASLFAGGYCWVLARRVRELKSLDSGLGSSIVTLTRQIELARGTLEEARAASRDTRQDLAQLVARADGAAGQLRLLIAAAPVPQPAQPPAPAAAQPVPEPAAATPAPAPPRRPAVPAEPAPVVAIRPLPQPEQAPRPPVPHLAEVPKPRALAPVENPLRRKEPEPAPASSEDDLLEALSALAGGR
jgi:hypothetical protein